MSANSRSSNSSSTWWLSRATLLSRIYFSLEESTQSSLETSRLFCRPNLQVSEPLVIPWIVSIDQFQDFGLGLRPPTFDPLLGSGIFTQGGAEWRHSRELLRPQFLTNRFNNFEQIRIAVDNLISCVPENDAVDLQPLFFRLTFETTLFLLFGQYLPALKSGGITGREGDFAEAFNLSQDYLAQRGRLGDFYWLLGGRKFRKACQTCHDFVDTAVKKALDFSTTPEAKSSKTDSYVFIDALIRESSDPKVLRDQCLNILLAGRDTTACCLTWAL